ncbi:TolC family protein [Azotosporobacter soli]|uniref:TolC family protein n=1 Tax=Azotosporobacter soli TaxID=3055040 RepID=UPI0031FEDFD4
MTIQRKWRRGWNMLLVGILLAGQTSLVQAAPTELTLEDSVRLALQNNPTVKIAVQDKASAQYGIKIAEGALLPSVGYTHTAAHGNSLTTSGNVTNKFDNKLSLGWNVYTFGQKEGLVGAARANYSSADFGVAKAMQQIKLDATNGYYGILQARNLLQVAQESVDQLTAHLKNVQAQYGVGTVAKSDVLRSEVELANAQQSLIKAQNTYDLSISTLNNVIGLPLGTELSVKEELQYLPYEKTLDTCIDYSLKNRPEVIQAAFGVEAAKENKRAAEGGHLPTIAVFGTQDWNNKDFPGSGNSNWSVGATLNWNAFDSGVTNANIGKAQQAFDKTLQLEQQTKDSVQLEVRQNFLGLREAEKRIDTSKVAVTKAEEDFKIAQVRYMAGVGTNIDVIDAQVALTQAKTNYYQALYDYNTSRAKLEKAMGIAVN